MAIATNAAQHKLVIDNRYAGLAFEFRQIGRPEQARYRNQIPALRAMEVVMMRVSQLIAGPAIVERELADGARDGQPFGGAEHAGKIRRDVTAGKRRVKVFQGPGMVLALVHQGHDRDRNYGPSSHEKKLRSAEE